MFAALVSLILAAAVTMRLTLQRGIQAKIATATVDMLRLPTDSGDGQETQRFAAEAQEKLQGFLNQPDVVAVTDLTRNATASQAFTQSGPYRVDEVTTEQRDSDEVTRELLPPVSRGSSGSAEPPGSPYRERPGTDTDRLLRDRLLPRR